MEIFKRIDDDNYLVTREQYVEMQNIMYSIKDLTDVMLGYCQVNSDNAQVYPLLKMIELIRLEGRRITNKF